MNPTELSIEQDTDTLVSQINTSAHVQPAKSMTLRDHVRAAVRDYLIRLEGATTTNLYERVVAEMEIPLLEIVLKYVQDNQSQAAKYLNLSRGTLRKKMKLYGFLGSNGKKKS